MSVSETFYCFYFILLKIDEKYFNVTPNVLVPFGTYNWLWHIFIIQYFV